jgi:mevalonate kinase
MMTFYSNGKLLLTGEYLVLKGAPAIALPLQIGQSLTVTSSNAPLIEWKSYYGDELFFNGNFRVPDFSILQTNENKTAAYIKNLLIQAFQHASLKPEHGYTLETKLDFPTSWGLGSSSTLINNIAQWLEVNAFKLNNELTGGSGYDIACAQYNQPLLYQLKNNNPVVETISWNPPYRDQLFFVYTGKKQHSAKEVMRFQKKNTSELYQNKIEKINNQVINSRQIDEFEQAITEHEELLASVLERPLAKEVYFKSFPGEVKSLGAWGGDFILVTWSDSESELNHYLKRHNLYTFFSWDEIIKN